MLIVVRQFNHEHWFIVTKFREIGQLLNCTHIWTCSENDNYLDRTQCYEFQLKDVLSDTSHAVPLVKKTWLAHGPPSTSLLQAEDSLYLSKVFYSTVSMYKVATETRAPYRNIEGTYL